MPAFGTFRSRLRAVRSRSLRCLCRGRWQSAGSTEFCSDAKPIRSAARRWMVADEVRTSALDGTVRRQSEAEPPRPGPSGARHGGGARELQPTTDGGAHPPPPATVRDRRTPYRTTLGLLKRDPGQPLPRGHRRRSPSVHGGDPAGPAAVQQEPTTGRTRSRAALDHTSLSHRASERRRRLIAVERGRITLWERRPTSPSRRTAAHGGSCRARRA